MQICVWQNERTSCGIRERLYKNFITETGST
jgi:serine/threonine protein kinase